MTLSDFERRRIEGEVFFWRISVISMQVLSGPFMALPSLRYIFYTSCGQQRAARQQRRDYCCRLAQSASQPLERSGPSI